MDIFGIGANFDNQDVSDVFISCSFMGIGWVLNPLQIYMNL